MPYTEPPTLAITFPNFYKLGTTTKERRNRFDLVKNCSITVEAGVEFMNLLFPFTFDLM